MHLETLIQGLIVALEHNTAALQVVANIQGKPAAQPAASPKTGTNVPKAGTGDLQYERDIKPIAFKLSQSNRPKLLEIYKELGVKVGTEIKPEQFAQALELLKAAG